MSSRRPGSGSSSRSPPSANEAFKARGKARQHWSMVAAVAIHAALFVFFPVLEQPGASPDVASESSVIELIAVAEEPAPILGIGLPPVVPLPDETESEQEDAPDNGGGPAESERTDAADAALDQLRRRTASGPAIVEPAPEPEPEPEPELDEVSPDAEGAEDDGRRIRDGEVSLPESAGSADDAAPDLDRLATLRPELAFGSPESWILIRNPSQVKTFLERRFGEDASGSLAPGMLSVAIWVDDRGSVEWAEIHRSSGRRALDEAAIELFTDVASFRPAREGGVRVPLAVIFWLPYPW